MARPKCIYKCDCEQYCQPYLKKWKLPPGLRQVSGGTWYTHAPYRAEGSAAYITRITPAAPQGVRHDPKYNRKRQFPPKVPTTLPPKRRKQNSSADPASDLPARSRTSSPDVDMEDAGAGFSADAPDASFADASRTRSTQSPAPPGSPGGGHHHRSASPRRPDAPDAPRSPSPHPAPGSRAPSHGPADNGPEWQDEDEDVDGDAAFGNTTTPTEEDQDEPVDIEEENPRDPDAFLADLRLAQTFIEGLKKATLDEDIIDKETLARLRDPTQDPLDISSPILRLSIDLYLNTEHASIATYENTRLSLLECLQIEILTYHQVEKRIADLSGVTPIYIDMCKNSCLAYTGPWKNLDFCVMCGHDRYEMRHTSSQSRRKQKVPCLQFLTIPLGPQIQARFRTAETAEQMTYRQRCTARIFADLQRNGFEVPVLSDYVHGKEYIDAVRRGDIKDDSVVVLLSMDGAQLYASKQSDCWIYIWVILEQAPDVRYKKEHVLIGGIIPGPNKPNNVDSFLFPGLHHVSALMKEGLPVWNEANKKVEIKFPYLGFATADSPGMSYLSGGVGHKGANGCRLFCGQKGRLKPNATQYCPATQLPHNYNISGSSHPDINLRAPKDPTAPTSDTRYWQNLHRLLSARNKTQYKKLRLETGLSKPSIFIGLPRHRMARIPGCFTGDIMHLAAINIPELMLSLWRGTHQCDKDDDKDTWDWAVLKGALWEAHGDAVGDARPYLPGSFDRPPRNIAQKINSGYKAIEWLNYLYGLCPVFLHGILPEKYWISFCKLVRGIRLVQQRAISRGDLREAYRLLIEFCEEYEDLYCQRKASRLHFMRQSVHQLIHIAPETQRVGPYIIFSQWTMERMIGELVSQIRQPSRPYQNLSRRGARYAQVSALRSMHPDLVRRPKVPAHRVDLQDGYFLLHPVLKKASSVSPAEANALLDFAKEYESEITFPEAWLANPTVCKWARISIPTGQKARSKWTEEHRANVRKSCNVKYRAPGNPAYAEVQYYIKLTFDDGPRAFAVGLAYDCVDEDLFRLSSRTVRACRRSEKVVVFPVKKIISVVAMVPFPQPNGQLGSYNDRVFVVDRIGMDAYTMSGIHDLDDDEGDEQGTSS